ncbi:MAG: hypothetical protein WDO19_06480 [Bacteroidota bacterium]
MKESVSVATTIKNIQAHLDKVYADHVGIEYKYISDQVKVNCLLKKWTGILQTLSPLEKKKRILEKINQGVIV